MAPDFAQYLAEKILSNGQTITYRQLSRDVNVHCNVAKSVLADWKEKREAAGCSATYLITGIPATACSQKESNDLEMATEEESDVVPQHLVTVCSESSLEASKAQFSEISSAMIYSLGPSPVNDLQTLSAGSWQAADGLGGEALEKDYVHGVIRNPRVTVFFSQCRQIRANVQQRRPDAALPAFEAVREEIKRVTSESVSSRPGSRSGKEGKSGGAAENTAGHKKMAPSHPAAKRQNSNIFKSFAKAQSKPRKVEAPGSAASAEASQTEQSQEQPDILMKESEESEDDGAGDFSGEQEETVHAGNNPKAVREQKLREMMDEEDDTPLSTGPTELETTFKSEEPAQEEQIATTSSGRRRGKRKVMKKKTMQDAEGYLITKEEGVWESFSEEDTKPPPKAKIVTGQKGTGPSASKGKGNIMSFFGKKMS